MPLGRMMRRSRVLAGLLLLASLGRPDTADIESVLRGYGVSVERLVDYDDGLSEYYEIYSEGIPNHRSSGSSSGFELKVPVISGIEDLAARALNFGGGVIDASKAIGVAVNGVQLWPSFDEHGQDLTKGSRDGCFGFSLNGTYVYRIAPPCLFGEERDYLTVEDASLGFDGQVVVALMNDGFLLYGPLDANGQPHDRTTLDECGGRYDDNKYAYYSTLEPPYTIQCWGPGKLEMSSIAEAAPDCPRGYFESAVRHPASLNEDRVCVACDAGRYALLLNGEECSGMCPVGHYCLKGTANVGGALGCPAGRFGDRQALKDPLCSGECPTSFYCPRGTSRPLPCGGATSTYCPQGSDLPRTVTKGYYTQEQSFEVECEPGTFCVDGVKEQCQAGRYGAQPGLTACSLECPAGSYCPEGSSAPLLLPAGRYSSTEGLENENAPLCPRGHYCPRGSVKTRKCPAGRYGSHEGLTDDACNARGSVDTLVMSESTCSEGFVCPEGSTSGTAVKCDSHEAAMLLDSLEEASIFALSASGVGLNEAVFCPAGSAAPTRVREGYYTVGSRMEVVCEPGFYCVAGLRSECAAGLYGAINGLHDLFCSGSCSPGYYCPAGSTRAPERPCGGPEVYCPLGSSEPREVGQGNYSTITWDAVERLGSAGGVGATAASDVRASETVCEPGYYCAKGLRRPCPAGRFGSLAGSYREGCEGPCPAGMFCLEGSRFATPVDAGFYCEKGGCVTGQGEGKCAAGYYCPRGSSRRTQRPCCDARRHDATGLWYRYGDAIDHTEQVLYGPIDGADAPGAVYDQLGWHQHDRFAGRCETLYCPAGSSEPLNVTLGHYATGGNRTTRTGSKECATFTGSAQALLLGGERAPNCPSTTQGPLFDDAANSGVAAASREPIAWETPLFLFGGAQSSHDTNQSSSLSSSSYEWSTPTYDELS